MVPALGKAVRVEDCISSRERAALLSFPCFNLAWLNFFELFWQPRWDNIIQFSGAEEPYMVPYSRTQQKSSKTCLGRVGWDVSLAQSHEELFVDGQLPVDWGGKAVLELRWWDSYFIHLVLSCLFPWHIGVSSYSACWGDSEGGWGLVSRLLFKDHAPSHISSSGVTQFLLSCFLWQSTVLHQ